MPYAPGIQYIGGQLLGQGIQQAAQGLTAGLERYAARKDATEQMRAQLAGPQVSGLATYAEAPGAATTPNGLADSMGTPEGPNEGTGEGNATEAEKKVHKLTKALRDIGEHGYGYSRPVVDSMGYNELTGLVRREEKLREQRQDALVKARLIQEAQHQQAQEDLALKQFGLAQAADKRAQQHMDSLLASEQLRREEDAAEGRALQRFGTPAQVPDPAAVLNSPLGQLQRYAGATREETPQESARAALATLPGGRGAKGVLSILAPYAYPKQPSALDLAHLQLYQAEAEKARREANAPPFMPSVVPLGPGQGSALRTSLNSSVPWERPQAESGVTTHVDANGNVVGSTVTENGKTFFRHADPGWKYTQRPDPVFPGKMIEEWTVTAPHGIAGMRAAQEQMQRANGASAPSSFEAELKLAREAISKGAPREKVAAQFKQRTGKDLP